MYSTTVDGEVLSFGTSGFLYQSNKLMYDRRTRSLWHQFRGEPVTGTLADSGIVLDVIPVTLTTWGEWLASHPDTTVLDVETGVYPGYRYLSESDPGSFYFDYRARPGTMFPVATRSKALPTKVQVLGLTLNGRERAYSFGMLAAREPVINDELGGINLVVVTPGIGGGPRAYHRGDIVFSEVVREAGTDLLLDESGDRWRLEEDALVHTTDDSQRLPRLPSRNAYWFGWYGFYPNTEVYGQDVPVQ